MKSTKIILLLLLMATAGHAQFVQPMGFDDYSVFGRMNIGNGKVKQTSPSAYLELGDANNSRKGFLLPRGNKDSVANPAKGLMFFDIPSGKVWVYNGTWSPAGSSGGAIGTGTIGSLPVWSSASTLGTSVIRDDGNNVGIGTPAHSVFKLYVNGHGYFNGTIGALAGVHTGADWKVTVDNNGYFRYTPDSSAAAAALKPYIEAFPGTSSNAFTLTKTPVAGSVVVYVNGQRLPAAYYTITVNTISINSGLLTFSTDTLDKIEISFQSSQ